MKEELSLEPLEKFNCINIADCAIGRIEIDIGSQRCSFYLDGAQVLKPGGDISDPEQDYEPARLTFKGVRSISCPEGKYCLNWLIINWDERRIDGDLWQFSLEMTGGCDNETFMRTLVIEAKDVGLGPATVDHEHSI